MSAGELLPGFVDIQVNGFRGLNFSSAELTFSSAAQACRDYLAASACAAFCPTVVTASAAAYAHALPILATVCELPEFRGRLIGLHLEGPFIAKGGGLGAHDEASVRDPDAEYFDELCGYARGHVRILTLSAEAHGAAALVRHAVSRGVLVRTASPSSLCCAAPHAGPALGPAEQCS